MGKTCGMCWGRREIHSEFLLGNLKATEHMEDLRKDRRIILNAKEICCEGKNQINLAYIVSFCEQVNELLVP
jgi:hypothetical protein